MALAALSDLFGRSRRLPGTQVKRSCGRAPRRKAMNKDGRGREVGKEFGIRKIGRDRRDRLSQDEWNQATRCEGKCAERSASEEIKSHIKEEITEENVEEWIPVVAVDSFAVKDAAAQSVRTSIFNSFGACLERGGRVQLLAERSCKANKTNAALKQYQHQRRKRQGMTYEVVRTVSEKGREQRSARGPARRNMASWTPQ